MERNRLFEQLGRLFFSRIRPLFFFALTLFPLLLTALFIFVENRKLQSLEERFAKASRKEKIAFERKMKKEQFLERYSNADPYFLDEQIESFPLLQAEKKQLLSLLHHPAFPESHSLKERLKILNENRLSFAEETIATSGTTSGKIKEIDEKQKHPVQMDESDLKKILSLLEDLPIASYLPSETSPQIIIKQIKLHKQETPLQTEIFEVEMDLLKREFSKS